MTPVEFISEQEGFSATPYKCPADKWTIGFGHVAGVTADTPAITREEALDLLAEDIELAQSAVDKYVTVPLSDNQNTALVSFTYNVGIGAFKDSTLLKLLNAGDYMGATRQFHVWNHIGSQVSDGLTKRRLAEAEIFNSD